VQDVSNAVTYFHTNGCEYALKSGGHNAIPGWSDTNGGVLLDTSVINDVTYDATTSSVRIGAGCKWMDVYSVLDPLQLTVMGGRDNTVGTGGYTLGGGISYYSNSRGFATDNIQAFEV
jgi:FAD/FMN-containing dehydrogenase